MKKIKILITLLMATAIFSQTSLSSSLVELVKKGMFSFETEILDYGTIEQNSDGNRFFVFTNTGEEPISISKIKGSCSCTVPSTPEAPIMPGEKAEIKVKYATNRVGAFNKTVTIYSNASEEIKMVRIKGNVIKAESTIPLNN
ncbi:DUF1573 domain-containing protein [Flavobacteriales bacterium]|nr:DUF1573 domain-containing protein [Flavobacteriales bacterium]